MVVNWDDRMHVSINELDGSDDETPDAYLSRLRWVIIKTVKMTVARKWSVHYQAASMQCQHINLMDKKMVATMSRACDTHFCFALSRAAPAATHGSRIAHKWPLTGSDALASPRHGAGLAVVVAVSSWWRARRCRAGRCLGRGCP